jgi:hypothetical protein
MRSGEPVIRVSAHPRPEGAYLSRTNAETLGLDPGTDRASARDPSRRLIAVDVRVDRGDGWPNELDGNPLWLLADRTDFEERVRALVSRTWSLTPYGRPDSPIFVSSTVPRVEIDAKLNKRLRRR